MKIGDEVYIHGYVDEIRKGTYVDIVIIRNKGGYFGTDASEVILADRKTEPQIDDLIKQADSLIEFKKKLLKTEPQTCANGCRWLNQYGECTEPSRECHIEYRTEVDEPQTERSSE